MIHLLIKLCENKFSTYHKKYNNNKILKILGVFIFLIFVGTVAIGLFIFTDFALFWLYNNNYI